MVWVWMTRNRAASASFSPYNALESVLCSTVGLDLIRLSYALQLAERKTFDMFDILFFFPAVLRQHGTAFW